jgi:hypothetical protein
MFVAVGDPSGDLERRHSMSAMRRSRDCVERKLSLLSTMSSQLTCFGV